MKRRHEVDEFFRKKLESYDSQPPMHLWEGISRRMDEKKEEKPLIPLFVLTTVPYLLLLGAIIVWLFVGPVHNNSSEKTPIQLGSFPIHYWSPAVDATSLPQVQLPVIAQPDDMQAYTLAVPVQQPSQELTYHPATAHTAIVGQNTATLTPEPPIAQEEAAAVVAEPAAVKTTAAPLAAEMIPSLDLFDQAGKRFFLLPQEIRCARFGGSTWHFYAELQGGLELPMREFQARNAEAVEYARQREQTELPSGAFSTMLRFSAISEKGLALRTGLQYAQINERFSYFNENEQRTIITDIYDSNGQLIRTDTVWVAGAEYTGSNRYRMINLPFIVGYERDLGAITFAINAGASLNLRMDAGGKYLSPDDLQQPVPFGSSAPAEQGNTYKTSLGLGWYGSLGFIYEMKHNWQLIAEPSFRIFPKSLTLGNHPVDHRYFIAGINLGIRRAL